VPPRDIGGATLHAHASFRFAVYDKRGGRPPELDRDEVLEWIGRFLGRLHAVGRAGSASPRDPRSTPETFGTVPRDYLLASGLHSRRPARRVDGGDVARARRREARVPARRRRRVRFGCTATCTSGNVLWVDHGGERGPHFVDFDDARSGPAIQDLWMLLSGDRESMEQQLAKVLEGYERFPCARPPRALAGRAAAHAAPAALFGVDRATLGRPGVPGRLSRGSARRATGRTASSSCASRSGSWTRRP
jgi:Ser/Thr protein kinase RdoA (MazF antagonist)